MEVQPFNGSWDEYRDHPAISQSDIKLFRQSRLAYYRRKILGEAGSGSTPSMEFGRQVERLIRHGLREFQSGVAVIPDELLDRRGAIRSAEAKKWIADREAEGLKCVKSASFKDEMTPYEMIWQHLCAHEHASFLTRDLGPQRDWNRRLLWTCPDTGLDRKGEVDLVVDCDDSLMIVDIKTTRDATEEGFARQALSLGYHIQAHSYWQAIELLTGRPPDIYAIICVHNAWPYEVAVYLLSADWIELGRDLTIETLADIGRLERKSHLWGVEHDGRARVLQLPRWATFRLTNGDQLDEY